MPRPDPRPIERVLVVYKTSPWERYTDEGLLGPDAPSNGGARPEDRADVAERLEQAHEIHLASAHTVHRVLEASGLDVTVAPSPTKRQAARADLVISVGGDGTFLATALQVASTPMLGINSAPGRSVGHYCGSDAEGFAATLDRIRSGTEAVGPLTRIAVRIGPRRIAHDALNEVLIAHYVPAASTRCVLRVRDQEEVQVSSGIWIATASGATGVIGSAGGLPMEPGEGRLQYQVREPYPRCSTPARLIGGLFDGPLEALARSPHLRVWLDGQHRGHRVAVGQRVRVERSEKPLSVYGYRGPGA